MAEPSPRTLDRRTVGMPYATESCCIDRRPLSGNRSRGNVWHAWSCWICSLPRRPLPTRNGGRDPGIRAISPVDGLSGLGLPTLTTGERTGKTGLMNTAGGGKIIRVTAAVITGAIALSGYAGVVGLLGGGISFGDAIDARLPFGSMFLAGMALLAIVAVPMTVASVAAGRGIRYGADIVFGAGLLLVAWIAVELAFIKAYSWFHPTYLLAAIVVLGLGWLMNRTAWPTRPGLELRDTQLHS